MKKLCLMQMLFFSMTLCLSTAFAQFEPHTQTGLPEGAIARFGKGDIQEIMYSPDGTQLAVTTSIGVWLHDARTGEELDLITGGHTDRVYAAAYSPDGETIATISRDKTVRLWDIQTRKNIKTLKGHTEGISSIAYSLDGKTIATGSADRTVRLWSARTGQNIKTLEGHNYVINSVKYSPDSDTLVSTSRDGTVRFWDVLTGRPLKTLTGYSYPITYSPGGDTLLITSCLERIMYSPDDDTVTEIISSEPETVYILNMDAEQPLRPLTTLNTVDCIAYSPDGKMVAIGSEGVVQLWDTHAEQPIKSLIKRTVSPKCIAFSADSKTIAIGYSDGTMQWWSVGTGEHTKTFTGYISNQGPIEYAPDGKTIAITDEGHGVSLWNANTGKHLKTLKGHESFISSIAFSPDGGTLATGSIDGTARLWDTHTGKNLIVLVAHEEGIDMLDYSPNGKTLATHSTDNEVRLWNTHNGKNIKTFERRLGVGSRFAYSPDGQIFATNWSGKSVQLRDTNTGKNIRTLPGHAWYIVFSPDGKTIATYTKKAVQLWDTTTGKNIKTLNTPKAFATAIVHLQDKPYAITTYESQRALLWDLTTGQRTKTFEKQEDGLFSALGHTLFGWLNFNKVAPWNYTIIFSPTADTFVTAGNNPVRLYNIATGKQIGKPIKHLKDEGGYTVVTYSPDGKTVATIPVGENFLGGTIRLWDVATRKLLKTLRGHSNCEYENSVAYSPDSNTIATAHKDGTVILWDLPSRK